MSATSEVASATVVGGNDETRLVEEAAADDDGDESGGGPARTLGWITGVACPVSLSMFRDQPCMTSTLREKGVGPKADMQYW